MSTITNAFSGINDFLTGLPLLGTVFTFFQNVWSSVISFLAGLPLIGSLFTAIQGLF